MQGINFNTFRQHIRNAKREQLLAMRSLIDNALERLDRDAAKAEEVKRA
jgi:hypothetical protein